jgi:hypothetical protein
MSERPSVRGEDILPGGAIDKTAQTRFKAAGGKKALVGKPVAEAEAWCQGHGFPGVLVEQQGGATIMSWSPNRIRLRVDDGIVIDAYLG